MQHSRHEIPERVLFPYRGARTGIVTMCLRDGDMIFNASGQLNEAAQTDPADLIFEIGSITKVFTALLLAVLVEEGKIDPNRPINALANDLSDVPPWITPQTLATHTSGLPRIHVPLWKAALSLPDDPYAAFSRRDLVAWLHAHKWPSLPHRSRHAYSNLGFGLLGEALAMSQGKPFLELLADKVITPLGLVDTSSQVTTPQQPRFMRPFNTKDKPVTPWTFQAMAAAGCLRSTARDLGHFSQAVIAALANPVTSLDRAICRSVDPLFGLGPRGSKDPVAQCLGWLSLRIAPDAPRMLFHNGGTAGSTCAFYICPTAGSAALILSNRGVAVGMWSNLKLLRSNPDKAMHDLLVGS